MANKIKIHLNPLNTGPGITDAFGSPDIDDEIQPKMVEVWDGKRIAWAIAILSALIIFPAVYLLYDSYWGEKEGNLQNMQGSVQGKSSQIGTTGTSAIVSRSTQSDASLQSSLPESASSGLSETKPEIKHHQPIIKLDSDDTSSLETTAATIANQQEKQEKAEVIKRKQTVSTSSSESVRDAEGKSSSEVSQSGISGTNQIKQSELKGSEVEPGTISLQPATKLSQGVNSLDIYQYLQSKHINRSLLVTDVQEREPVGDDIDTVQVDKESETKLYFFTDVKGLDGQTITYRWLHGDKPVFSKTVPVNGNYRWRSYTSKRIPYSMPGRWRVELLDSEGHLLTKHDFTVVQATEDSTQAEEVITPN